MTEEQIVTVKKDIERMITHIAHKNNIHNDEVISVLKSFLL